MLTFNAGVVGARGLFDELKTQVPQPVLVIEGAADKRGEKRGGYADTVPDLARGDRGPATFHLGNAPASWRTRSARSYCARATGDSRRLDKNPSIRTEEVELLG